MKKHPGVKDKQVLQLLHLEIPFFLIFETDLRVHKHEGHFAERLAKTKNQMKSLENI